MAYEEYIKKYLSETGSVFGKCREACKAMLEAFPELTIVRGHVHDAHWGLRSHWWLTDPAGNIVDPTVSQFPKPTGYAPWKPGDPVRVGACMDCGSDIYRKVLDLDEEDSFCDKPGEYASSTFCSQSCEDAFVRSPEYSR